MYFFTEWDLARKLLEKYQEGLTIMLIVQDNEYNRKLEKDYWSKMPCSVWWFPESDGINHHKFTIVDGQILWHGSMNFTLKATTVNQEEFTRDKNLAKVNQFAKEFTRLRKVIDEERRIRSQLS